MRTSRKILAAATAAGLLAVGAAATGASADPSRAPRLGEAFVNGNRALERAGDRLPEIAARYGLNPGELRQMFLADPTLAMDRSQRLAYFDELEPAESASTSGTAIADIPLADAFALSSLPGAEKTIYLDFDGHVTTGTTWNSSTGQTVIDSPAYDRDGDPTTFNDEERRIIIDSWAVVAEDFAPWNVNVTTIDPGADDLRRSGSGDTRWGVRVVTTGDDWNNCGCGGFAYLGSFDDSADEPAFVFNSSFVGVSEAITHEVGHTLLLNHDGLASGTTYYRGHDTDGTPGWAPIMGASYYEPVTQWSKQEYFGANNTGQDDLAIIGSLTNGNNFGLRADDHGDGVTAPATTLTTQQVDITGVIETRDDVDAFSFTTNGGDVTFSAYGADVGPNLDIRLTLRDSGGAVVVQDNIADGLDAGFDAQVPAGTYTVEVEGVGVGSPAANPPSGYTDYASIGQYRLVGSTGPTGPDTTPPAAPSGVTAREASSAGDVVVTWNANLEGDLASYAVSRSGAPAGPFSLVGTVSAPTTSFVDTTAPLGTSFYVVTATDSSGNTSNESAPATITLTEPDTTPPAAPTGVTASEQDGDVTVSWDANGESDLGGYVVERSTSMTGPFATIANVAAGTTSFVDAGAPFGDVFYVVRAVDESGNTSNASAPATVNVPEPPIDRSRKAVADVSIAGSVSGTLGATTARGGATQTVTEVESGGRPNRRHDLAEHRWTIPASEGNQTLTVVASATSGGDADSGFAVEWSTDGATWVPFATIGEGSSIDVTQSIGAPVGNVIVRIVDTDRSRGNTGHDSVSVDFLQIDGDGEVVEPPTPTMVVASLSTGTQGAGKGRQFGVVTVRVRDDQGGAVSGATVTVAVSGSFAETLSGTTDSSGDVTLRTAASAKKPSVVACVVGITGTALPYTAGTEGC